MIRLGEIKGNAYNDLQKALCGLDEIILNVEEMPGIFDLQITWKTVPSIHEILKIYEIGEEVSEKAQKSKSSASILNKTVRKGALVSDIQTTVTKSFNPKTVTSI